ncbi:hypothetical protein GCM10007874_31990 [Labrys miyagiensis]|uniref:Uncharacterized protein n=1 Tax=Labrys miyagiensis TaxID=346912 RepID=A0ABQ6CKM5_9HYPH|nr:hypothetical protein GCM10007874_31990 [Labrys miyagiensis]
MNTGEGRDLSLVRERIELELSGALPPNAKWIMGRRAPEAGQIGVVSMGQCQRRHSLGHGATHQ